VNGVKPNILIQLGLTPFTPTCRKPQNYFLKAYSTKGVNMNWQQICENLDFRDLPYKIELSERGQILMSPAGLAHGAYQSEIVKKMAEFMSEGRIVTECTIRTVKGTKVADVAWFGSARWEQVKNEYDSPVSPEICVEILSHANTGAEMKMKRKLYFSHGAEEVWICDENGAMTFHNPKGKIGKSRLVPGFPKRIA